MAVTEFVGYHCTNSTVVVLNYYIQRRENHVETVMLIITLRHTQVCFFNPSMLINARQLCLVFFFYRKL